MFYMAMEKMYSDSIILPGHGACQCLNYFSLKIFVPFFFCYIVTLFKLLKGTLLVK